MIKSSGSDIAEGNSYMDDKFQDNITNARSFGNALPRVIYHFLGGYNVGADPIDEANWWVDNVGVNLQVGEAYEFDAERGVATEPAYALAALDQAKARLGWGGGLYISQSRLVSEDFSSVAAAGYFVHPANWGVSTADNFSVGAFGTYSFQQYTDKATWPGISAPCDGNAFFGNAAIDILSLGMPAVVTPPPIVIPVPPIIPVEPPVVTPPIPEPIVVPDPEPTPTPQPTPEPIPTPVVIIKQDPWYIRLLKWLFNLK